MTDRTDADKMALLRERVASLELELADTVPRSSYFTAVEAMVDSERERNALREKLSELHAAASELCRHYRFYGKDPDAGSEAYDRLYQLLKEEWHGN